MLAYKFRLYPNKEEKLEAERPKLKLVDGRPHFKMKQEAPPDRAG